MNTEQKLRLAIKQALSKVTEGNSPNVYAFIHNKDGKIDTAMYNRMENRIVDKMLQNNLPVDAAIPQIEIEMGE
ncbi:MAG: hypothetical protein EOM76_11105 [Sphingobacteriia bacterium]|nr:hypothetical protein [Sphingobacteriia bacterium]